jgi:hypothetical protein
MKNLIIAAVVGTLFMAGGFYVGMRMMPVPPPKATATTAQTTPGATVATPAPDAISIETLKKTSETMMNLNKALQAREQAVAERERKVAQREEELSAEREALDQTHEQFKVLFNQFQSRLQLVEASQMDQLQKEASLYTAMGTEQSIGLIRAMDDADIAKLFSVMDTKPLGKLLADWKAKFPSDGPRLLHALNGMAEVMPKDKIAISDPAPTSNVGAPDAPAADATPATAPAPATDTSTPATTPGTSSTDASPSATPDTTPSLAPPADSTSPAPALPTPPDSNKDPVSTATTN